MSVYKKSILDLPLCIKIKLCNQSLILSFIDLHELHELHLVKKKQLLRISRKFATFTCLLYTIDTKYLSLISYNDIVLNIALTKNILNKRQVTTVMCICEILHQSVTHLLSLFDQNPSPSSSFIRYYSQVS